jgi:hypothetical protein
MERIDYHLQLFGLDLAHNPKHKSWICQETWNHDDGKPKHVNKLDSNSSDFSLTSSTSVIVELDTAQGSAGNDSLRSPT